MVGAGWLSKASQLSAAGRHSDGMEQMQIIRLPNALGDTNEQLLLGDAVIAPKGRLVFVSGQVSVNDALEVVGTTLQEQMAQCYANVDRVLTQAESSFQHAVQLMMFIHKQCKMDASDLFALITTLNRKYNPDGRPSCTAVYVEALALEGLLLELQVVAVIPD